MVNIYDSANQVAADLRQIDEYKALEKAIAEVKNNEKSLKLFQEMDKMQTKIIDLQSQGKDLPKELQNDYQKLNEEVQKDPQIIKLLQTEQALYKLIDDIQKAITKPVSDLYDDLRN
jgi:cell fate (sporulation/competence/biofilm development) regulator YlbF (YheA/YmcA/DUF963 family)